MKPFMPGRPIEASVMISDAAVSRGIDRLDARRTR